jgi:hypothetical protein
MQGGAPARARQLATAALLAGACGSSPPQLPADGGSDGAATQGPTTGGPADPPPATSTSGAATTAVDSSGGPATTATSSGGMSTGESSGGAVPVVCEGAQGHCHTPLPAQMIAGQRLETLATGDLDGDGFDDVVLGDNNTNSVIVLLSDGAGGLIEHQTAPTGASGLRDVVVADFDGDGDLDVATANEGSQSVAVLVGTGDGLLAFDASIQAGFYSPRALAAGDLDGDGALDLVTGLAVVPGFSVRMGPDLARANPPFFSLSANPDEVSLGQAGGDALPDVVAATRGGDRVWIVPGLPAGNFDPGATVQFNHNIAIDAHLADVDADGLTDVIAVADSAIHVHAGVGVGEFDNADTVYPLSQGIRAAAFADINLDGHPDVVVATDGTEDIAFALGAADGTFGPPVSFPYMVNFYDVALGDLNGDGALDAVACARNEVLVAVVLSATTTGPG